MIEEGHRRMRSFRGKGGGTEVFTTFQDTLYLASFLPPIPASSFQPEETLASYRAVAESLQKLSDREHERLTRMLADEHERYDGMRRRGGSSNTGGLVVPCHEIRAGCFHRGPRGDRVQPRRPRHEAGGITPAHGPGPCDSPSCAARCGSRDSRSSSSWVFP